MEKMQALTAEKTELMATVRNEWINFCLGGDQEVNRRTAMKGIRWMYGMANLKAPLVVFVDGPLACQYAVFFIKQVFKKMNLAQVWDQVWDQVGDQVRAQVGDQVRDQVGDQVWDQVGDQVRDQVGDQVWAQVGDQVGDQVWDQVGDQVRAQVWDQVRAQVGDQVWDQVRDQVGDQVWDQVWDQVGDQVRAQVWDQVGDQVGDQVRDQVRAQVGDQPNFNNYSWCDASDSGWVAFFDFFDKIGIRIHENFKTYREYVKSGVFMTIFLEGVAICCPRPKSVKKATSVGLHSSTGPAIEWKNEAYYFLNGVRVPKELVMTDAGQLDAEKWLRHENADVRAEFIRKYGIERLKSRGKVVDTWKNYDDVWFERSEYELVDMSPVFTRLDYAPYLSMRNQSVPGVWHMEAVPRTVRTVQEAVEFRTKTKNPKIINIK